MRQVLTILAFLFCVSHAGQAAAAGSSFHFVWWTDRPYLLVTQDKPAGVQFEARQASLAADGVTLQVVDPIVKGTEGKQLAERVGQEFEVRGSTQATCTAVAVRPVQIAIVIGEFYDLSPALVEMRTERAHWMALELRPKSADCSRNFYWARASGGPPLLVVPGVSSPHSPALQGAIEGTTMWRAAQREFETFDRNFGGGESEGDPSRPLRKGRWDASAHVAAIVRFTPPSGMPVIWQMVTAGDGCGDFIAGMTAVWLEAGGLLRLASPQDKQMEDTQQSDSFRPEIAVDLDGDNTLELVGPAVLYKRTTDVWRVSLWAPKLFVSDPC